MPFLRKILLNDYDKCIVTIEGSELARGGGPAVCPCRFEEMIK